MSVAERWLDREDAVCREGRLARLNFIASPMPVADGHMFWGGLIAKYLFEEARYCFVYGQYMAAVVLGMSFIEHTLAAEFYAAGRNDLERSSLSGLLNEAQQAGWLSENECQQLNEVRIMRNPITHFRAPGSSDTVEHRSVLLGEHPYEVLEGEARLVMQVMFRFLSRSSV